MTSGRVSYELLDHEADTGIVVRAKDLTELFEIAASAMFDLMVDVETVDDLQQTSLQLESRSLEDLLIDWLEELLSRAMATDTVYGRFEVDFVRPSGDQWELSARVAGETLDLKRHRFRTELKAATFHHLRVARTDDGWTARVVFDQ